MNEPYTPDEFSHVRDMLRQAKLGCYLILPLKYEHQNLRLDQVEAFGTRRPVDTMDLTESVRERFNGGGTAQIGACYEISRETLIHGLFGRTGEPDVHSFSVSNDGMNYYDFDFCTSYLYLFHTQVAFLCLGLRFPRIEALNKICNLSSAELQADCRCLDASGQTLPFSLAERAADCLEQMGLQCFFTQRRSLLLESYPYTLALVPQRFQTLECIRQVTFNLHQTSPLDRPVEDSSEEDVHYVYALKNQDLGSYRWGCCVSSQTISYVMADEAMDMDKEMSNQARDGLPLTLIALYEKYTCLRFTQLITTVDKRQMKQLRALKRMMLDFRAYGTVDPAIISRWHNVKRIYQATVETNGVPGAIEDVNNKLNILVEHQREIESARNDTVSWVLTLFGIVSILASILSIIQILSGGDPLEWFVTIMSSLLIALLVAIVVIMRRKDE